VCVTYHTIPYHTMPYHIISYHIILYLFFEPGNKASTIIRNNYYKYVCVSNRYQKRWNVFVTISSDIESNCHFLNVLNNQKVVEPVDYLRQYFNFWQTEVSDRTPKYDQNVLNSTINQPKKVNENNVLYWILTGNILKCMHSIPISNSKNGVNALGLILRYTFSIYVWFFDQYKNNQKCCL
jgi:hypothetical protein